MASLPFLSVVFLFSLFLIENRPIGGVRRIPNLCIYQTNHNVKGNKIQGPMKFLMNLDGTLPFSQPEEELFQGTCIYTSIQIKSTPPNTNRASSK